MRPVYALTGMMLAACSLMYAQGGRLVVPGGNSSRPRVVDAATSNGSITIVTYNGKDVIVESGSIRHRDRDEGVPAGMHRLDIPDRGLDVESQDNTITVRDHSPGGGSGMVITVPVDTSLHLRSSNGSISVDGVHGEIDAETHNGGMKIMNVSGSVLANTNNSRITVTMDHVDSTKPSAFSTLNGSIDVTLPSDLKATMKMTTDNGSIYSDFDVNVTPGRVTTQLNNTSEGKYRMRFDRTVVGTINGGGADLTFRTANGSITIRKGK